jgi:hypothetical protein
MMPPVTNQPTDSYQTIGLTLSLIDSAWLYTLQPYAMELNLH